MPTGVPLPSSIEPEETRWQRILADRERDGKPLSAESKRGLQAYIRERKESPIILVEIPRTARMGFPTIAGQEVGSGEERAMHVHERMLWMKTRDGGVEGEESNMQKVSGGKGDRVRESVVGDGADGWCFDGAGRSASWRTSRTFSLWALRRIVLGCLIPVNRDWECS